MFEEFPSLESAKKWAEGLSAETLLIHEKQHVKADLFGKNVVFDTVFKTVRKRNLQEIWVHQLKILC